MTIDHISLVFFRPLNFMVVAGYAIDLPLGRIGCTRPLRQFLGYGDSGVSSFQMVSLSISALVSTLILVALVGSS